MPVAGSASYNRQLAMQQMLEAMETALRVLADLNEKRHPDPADVDALRVYAGPQPEIRALDELACEVIQTVLRRSADVRAAERGSD
jgi:hypothetical protein